MFFLQLDSQLMLQINARALQCNTTILFDGQMGACGGKKEVNVSFAVVLSRIHCSSSSNSKQQIQEARFDPDPQAGSLHPCEGGLPSDSSRSSSASWSLTSLGRADRSTPRSAMVCSRVVVSGMTVDAVPHEALRKTRRWRRKNKNQIVEEAAAAAVVVFTPSP